MPLPRDAAGRATRTAGLDQTGYFETGDYVVPEYNDTGSKTAPGQAVGDAANIIGMAQRMAAHAELGGAIPLFISTTAVPTKKKGSRSSPSRKAAEAPMVSQTPPMPILRTDGLDPNVVLGGTTAPLPQSNTILQPSSSPSLRVQIDLPVPPIEVVFSTQLGRIKLNASAVLDSENALMLVFADEGEIRYEPAPGTNVQLIIDGKLEDTMYPGFKFPWIDNKMRLMVFVKLPAES